MERNTCSPLDYYSFLLAITTTSNKAKKRWRFACFAIYSHRVMLSLAKEILSRRSCTDPNISCSVSHSNTALDIRLHPASMIANVPLVSSADHMKLIELVKDKDLATLCQVGGVEGIAASLGTEKDRGIRGHASDVTMRRDTFGSNTYQKPPPKGLLHFVIDAFKDTTILILLVCAGLSLGFGMKEHGVQEGWYEGGSIFVAVFLVIAVSAFSNYRQETQFDKLSKISNNIKVNVVRDARPQQTSIFDVVVGDVVLLTIGDQIPADGLFLGGHSLQIDESSMTGESDHVEIDPDRNPFLFSGSKVVDGYARMLVVSVGMNTAWGEMMSSISGDSNERTPLQARLDKLTSSIGKYNGSKTSTDDILNAVVQIVAAAVTIVVVAIPEGLPLAVTLTLAYSMKRMMADQAMVRKLSACETMGSATVICTDKTGTLTLNKMKVTQFCPTEKAILSWAFYSLNMQMEEIKKKYNILYVETFNSEKKRSGVLINEKSDATMYVHWKGAAEMILAMCSTYYQIDGNIQCMDDAARRNFEKIIQDGLTLLGIVGIKDPCRPGAKKAVETCLAAGVDIKMITGDNAFTAKAIAIEFNQIRVMARSSPFDKLLMVQCLKNKGHVVAVTGDGTNDAPALKEADIGLSMGIQGTEVAKESSDIVILDDNFTSLVTVLRWGRCVYNNIQKFIQFQLTVNVAALVINFIAAVSAGEVPLTAVQLLWVNLIMDTLGALALATERPSDELMEKSPVGRTEPLITNVMWRNLLAQALYQIAVLLTLQFRGESIFNNHLFIAIIGITIVLQVIMVEFLKKFADTERLNWWQWAACILLAAASWPIGWLVKLIPVSTPWMCMLAFKSIAWFLARNTTDDGPSHPFSSPKTFIDLTHAGHHCKITITLVSIRSVFSFILDLA
ncbi:hypothetical protein EUGRSUZ_B01472 [Eucalyptus grandis]|uniref:Uncharacterized protein n=2 Tax=Eucalyptus grandis TaxID=71139 RepID=A0ACC3LRL0_EUCGR|nr:hypothetical protein EUGRSUZ_B01472 [Eucalyptus grandis]